VLLTPRGDVVAAASEPWDASLIADDAWGQRRVTLERTLRQPTFQPPGSVFKPFVAALALERSGYDPGMPVLCGPIERGGAGYQDIRCWRHFGHGEVDLDAALVGSCNAYFAWLGESLGDADLREAADLFGFGHPTGIRTPPPWDAGQTERLGMSEDVPVLFTPDRLSDFHRRLAGNGLGVVQATPMQLARATAGLATGFLPGVRLVRRIGERDVSPATPARIPIAERNLARVRKALAGVAADPGGTAHLALNARALGLDVAVKTGSADLTSRADEEGKTVVRKHTWVAGWTPAERPAAIFVIFVHDTHTTSSHGAVYVARQFLRQPETRAWLAAQGVTLGSLEQGRAR
jgi:penicillin-binding protein 2